jgi:hypothetical protein
MGLGRCGGISCFKNVFGSCVCCWCLRGFLSVLYVFVFDCLVLYVLFLFVGEGVRVVSYPIRMHTLNELNKNKKSLSNLRTIIPSDDR